MYGRVLPSDSVFIRVSTGGKREKGWKKKYEYELVKN